jgi:hypothetical protein
MWQTEPFWKHDRVTSRKWTKFCNSLKNFILPQYSILQKWAHRVNARPISHQHCAHGIFHTEMNVRLLGHWDRLQWQDLVVTEEPSHSAVGTSWTARYWKPMEGQGYNEIYPIWPRNDAFPQLLLSKYCIHLRKYAVRQHMITFPVEQSVISFFVSALRKIFWHHLSKLSCTPMTINSCHI